MGFNCAPVASHLRANPWLRIWDDRTTTWEHFLIALERILVDNRKAGESKSPHSGRRVVVHRGKLLRCQ
ncbi:hypothetical protein SBV1_3460010 [Verrucomicrobia bacterium]|nr:hypothetical protein SBV1_3460010 [Verrucomicrobiota bacterium]